MPTSKPYSIYAGGYSEEKKARLQATKLPEKLRCKQCKKLKVTDGYSQRQLLDFRQRLARNPALASESTASVVCRTCTGGQVTELECTQCNTIKALEGFTKAQRRDPDFARCILCVNLDLKEPTAGLEGGRDDESTDDNSDDNDGMTNPYADTVSNAGTGNTAYIEHGLAKSQINSYSDDSDDNPFAPKKARTMPKKENQEKAKSAASFTGYDAAGRAYRQSKIPSLAATATSRSTTVPRSNFARVKSEQSADKPKGLIEETPEAKAVGRQVYIADDDSDSDDYGYI
ncbi:MAG: hypothetical protein Q9195_000609 [Heterodermia aff. obscurata]